jgi:small-conductance mechanosensitive channel
MYSALSIKRCVAGWGNSRCCTCIVFIQHVQCLFEPTDIQQLLWEMMFLWTIFKATPCGLKMNIKRQWSWIPNVTKRLCPEVSFFLKILKEISIVSAFTNHSYSTCRTSITWCTWVFACLGACIRQTQERETAVANPTTCSATSCDRPFDVAMTSCQTVLIHP